MGDDKDEDGSEASKTGNKVAAKINHNDDDDEDDDSINSEESPGKVFTKRATSSPFNKKSQKSKKGETKATSDNKRVPTRKDDDDGDDDDEEEDSTKTEKSPAKVFTEKATSRPLDKKSQKSKKGETKATSEDKKISTSIGGNKDEEADDADTDSNTDEDGGKVTFMNKA